MFNNFNLKDKNWHLILDSINIGIYWKNKESCYLGCNQYMCDILGINDKNDIIGKTDHDVLSITEAAKTKKTDLLVIKNGYYVGEETFTSAKGKEKIFLINKTQLLDEHNQVVGIVGSAVEITQIKKQMQLENQQSRENEESKLTQIIDLINASIYWRDMKGRILGCNKYVLNLFNVNDRKDIIGKNQYDYLPKDEADKITEIDNIVFTQGLYQGEEYVTVADNKQNIYLATKTRLLDRNGNIIGTVGISMDITAQKEAEQFKIEQQENERFQAFMEQMTQLINHFQFADVKLKQGKSPLPISNTTVKLAKREKQILFFLALSKEPKEIANIISSIENKDIAVGTIQAIINKRLYPKLNVNNVSQLIEKANSLGLIPFRLPTK